MTGMQRTSEMIGRLARIIEKLRTGAYVGGMGHFLDSILFADVRVALGDTTTQRLAQAEAALKAALAEIERLKGERS